MSYTVTIIEGRVGKDSEMRYTPKGTAVTNFNVACDVGWGDNKKTMWTRVTVWGKLAEVCNEFVTKGKSVLVQGEMNPDADTGSPRLYESNGEMRASFELTADKVVFLGGKDNAVQPASEQF